MSHHEALPKPRRVRGYRIHIWRGAAYAPPSLTTPIMWRTSPLVSEWQRVIADPSTQQASMLRSGRKMRAFQFCRKREADTS